MATATARRAAADRVGALAAPARPRLLSAPGNTKLGEGIYSFSLPAHSTCPGFTAICALLCYAMRGRYRSGAIKRRYLANLERAGEPTFARDMIKEIRTRGCQVVRVHASGDFYDLTYVEAWIRIAQSCPDVRFFAYTRSWRVSPLRRALRQFSALPNVFLWASADRDSGRPPRSASTRVAWLAAESTDEDQAPKWADLVFRNKRDTIRKRVGRHGIQVCPVEQGLKRDLTCTVCQICFTRYPLKRVTSSRTKSTPSQLSFVRSSAHVRSIAASGPAPDHPGRIVQ